MAEKHTPGPWACSGKPNGPWWQIAAGNQSICTAHATCKKNTPIYAVMFKANAQLIAAAPELLEALRRAVLQNSHDMMMTGDELRKCNAAIAKATGATSAPDN